MTSSLRLCRASSSGVAPRLQRPNEAAGSGAIQAAPSPSELPGLATRLLRSLMRQLHLCSLLARQQALRIGTRR
jgi:hypothetical protein